ncbi:autophagy-related protein 13b [Mercurialis annua]|uniref:autophagy-related protein 13b n=1 Tax=Mercurialis annua TaxID=3986 RepID=UPI00215EDEFD|nr:autophagy-related protein 13b [Mercurialis annua]XP_050206196.1 autophagy-related protein 13b [Mercurialis annua]
MASNHSNTSNTHTEAAKVEQIITEFFAKSLHIILESRSSFMSSRNYSGEQVFSSPSPSSSSSSSSGVRPRDKWFNLALRECPAALENLDIWRQGNLEPMVVDVVLVERPLDWDPLNCSPRKDFGRTWNFDQEEVGCDADKSEKIVERWILQYESRKTRDSGSGSRRSSNTLHTLYKKSILLLRSLYLTVRLLPAYKIFRDLSSSGQIQTFTLTHRVSSFADPFSRKEEAEMQRFGFSPVETSSGRLCLSVLYHASLSDVRSESSTPVSPQFIPNYVGSPLADPIKRFPSLPASHGSPSSLPFSRRHSWSYDRYKASPPSFSFSPSPTHSESHASLSNPNYRRLLQVNLPPHPPETSSSYKKNTSFDEYSPSPNFTPSPSPSPPIYIPGSHLSKALLRSESAPVSIPASKLVGSPVLSSKQNLPPSPPIKGIRSSNPRADRNAGQAQTGISVEKCFSLGKYDVKRYSGMKISSNCSPQISYSRSSSRSYQDDFDESDFPCPFDLEEDDMTDPGSRPESYDQKGPLFDPLEPGGLFPIKISQDAAVGALVRMLKKAPPLRQDFSTSVDILQESRPKLCNSNLQEHIQISETPAFQQVSSSIASSGFVASKTTADALEELQGYKEIMKELLLNQASRSSTSVQHIG